jgi:hypothetical protein
VRVSGREVAHDAEDGAFFDIGAGPRAHREQAALELFAGAVADALAQSDRGGHVECLELVEQPRAFRDRGAPNVQQRPQRGERPAPSWRREVLASEYALGRGERVDAVGLPHAALRPPRTFDLDDGVAGVLQMLAQTGAPAAGALDAKIESEAKRLANVSDAFQQSLGAGREKFLELQGKYLAAKDNKAREEVMAQVPAVTQPWLDAVEKAAEDIADAATAAALDAANLPRRPGPRAAGSVTRRGRRSCRTAALRRRRRHRSWVGIRRRAAGPGARRARDSPAPAGSAAHRG